MKIKLSGKELEGAAAWEDIPGTGARTRCLSVPTEIGSGSVEQIQFRERFILFISDLTFSEDIEFETTLEENALEIMFCMSGAKHLGIQAENIPLSAGTGGIFYGTAGMEFSQKFRKGGRVQTVGIFLTAEFLQHYDPETTRPFRFLMNQKAGQKNNYQMMLDSFHNNPRITLLLQDLIQSIPTSPLRYIFLEARCLELISLQLESLFPVVQESQKLPTGEIRKLHQARELLEKEYLEPPSIIEIARRISLNEFKLKSGFKKLFGSSLYSHLRDYRMEVACSLLKNGEMKVIEAACAVGYSNPSHFAAAFRKKYGINPGALLKSERQARV